MTLNFPLSLQSLHWNVPISVMRMFFVKYGSTPPCHDTAGSELRPDIPPSPVVRLLGQLVCCGCLTALGPFQVVVGVVLCVSVSETNVSLIAQQSQRA